MMKKLLFAAVLLSVIAGCKPKTPETPKQVSVYLDFSAEGSFTLYQKIGAGRYTVFTGSYNVDQNNKLLSGTYSNGKQWGPYDCTCSESSLTLVTYGGGETYTYNKIDAVPSSVTGNTY